jgi:SAM-dependent methyltransferase
MINGELNDQSEYQGYRSWKGWGGHRFGYISNGEAVYFKSELLRCGITNLSEKKLLEIGFGNGSFAVWSKSEGAIYTGIEVIPELVDLARTAGLNAFLAKCSLLDLHCEDELDLIFAFDVFEHLLLEDVVKTLSECSVILRTGGILVARIPSGDSPFSRSIQYGDVTHKTILGSSAIRQIATRSGFDVVSIEPAAFPVMGQGLRTFLRRSMVRIGRYLIYPIIKNVLMGGERPVLTPNLVFVLKKK